MYAIDKGKPFTSLHYLRILGQIPITTEKSYLKKFNRYFLITKFATIFFSAVGPTLHLIMSLNANSDTDVAEDISVAFGCTGVIIFSMIFGLKYREWSTLFIQLIDMSEYGKPSNFEEIVNRLNLYGKICFSCTPSVAIIYGIAAWYSAKGCNTEGEINQICPAFVPIWLPFSINNMVIERIIFLMQFILIGLSAQAYLTECFVMYEATEIFICRVGHLKEVLGKVFVSSSTEELRHRLRFFVYYHIHLIKLGDNLSSLIKYTNGHMTILSALVCGCVANQMYVMDKVGGSLIYMAAWLFSLFCFCYTGQRIKDETLSVGDRLWDSKWYKTDARTQRDINFILLRCKKPLLFKALPFGVLDYPFYIMMIKTGYSYFALLNQSM